jgi:hypothetical protein
MSKKLPQEYMVFCLLFQLSFTQKKGKVCCHYVAGIVSCGTSLSRQAEWYEDIVNDRNCLSKNMKTGLLEAAQSGSLFIDCSTIDVSTSRNVAVCSL